ncbi:hypothetical protein ACFSKU_08490 [Pontibacter silvestris]|uniref:Uncharacterized protein n=1 Tax=Pontibacter silvestris TaxID=2305183 RepID=A0ABW4WXL9_9BACT|nr:hypothetical protein [Pontibacter silvestris]MCC9137415.1 hypothetical protein [Pontibacter silvestris]
MNNYVLLYRFDEEESVQQFEDAIVKEFPRHQVEKEGEFKYFGFAGEPEPGVVDKLNTILTSMGRGRNGYFGKTEYVALYFSREKDNDNIKRQLLIGTEEMVDEDAQRMSNDAHRDSIQNLLEFNYLKV